MSELVGKCILGIYTMLRSNLGFDFDADPMSVHMIPLLFGSDSPFVIFRQGSLVQVMGGGGGL